MSQFNSNFERVRKTQIALFRESGVQGNGEELINCLGPEKTAHYLGLNYVEADEIPSHNPKVETAGILDRHRKLIVVSKKFPAEQRRLTGMHEIVHWMIHQNIGRDVMHRDRPIDYIADQTGIDRIEWEATKIACLCLMPEKLVKDRFAMTFGLSTNTPLRLDEDTAFRLNIDFKKLQKMTVRQKSLTLAKASRYGRCILPMHQQFKVSPTAMAIRLEELKLIAPERKAGKPTLYLVR